MIDNLNKCLEKTTCFSTSLIWRHIQLFYQTQGINAWNQKIPYTVTNARITAQHHAHIILQHAKGPYSIIDYGAGVGQHGYYLAQYLTELAPLYQKPLHWFTLYLAEISEDTRKSWESNPNLKPYIQSKLITPLSLSGNWSTDLSNIPLAPQHCLIANYLLDSMPFKAYDNQKLMGLSLYAKRKFFPNPTLEQIILKPGSISEEKHPYPLLAQRYGSMRYTIPAIAIDFIGQYFENSQDALMILNDKMFINLEDIDYNPLFNLTLEGCYSTTLNMDAILQIHKNLHYHITNHCQRLQTVILGHHAIPTINHLNCSDIASLFEYYKQQKSISACFSHSLAKSLAYDPFCLEILSQSIVPDHTSESTLLSLIDQCKQHIFHTSHPFFYLHASKILRQCSYYTKADYMLSCYHEIYDEHPAYHLEKGILHHQKKEYEQARHFLKMAMQDNRTLKAAKALLTLIDQ